MKRLGFYKNMRYGADRARLLANPGLVLGDYQIEDGVEKQFNKDNIEIELANGELTVKSKKKDNLEKDVNLIHQGISLRSFVRKFTINNLSREVFNA